jgi:putative ABC transport system permease protein
VWSATLWMAVRELGRNLMRSMLTALGIVIGVASVIAMVTLGQSATAQVTAEISSLGQNLLIVTPGADRRGPVGITASAFTLEDVHLLEKEVPEIAELAPCATKGVLAVYGNSNYSTVAYGSTNAYFDVRSLKLARGRTFSDAELAGGTPACVLGETVRRQLFANEEALDAIIRVGSIACHVAGLVESKGQNTMGQDQDDFIIMPLPAVQRRLAGNNDVNMVFVSSSSEQSVARAKSGAEAVLRERRHILAGQKDDFNVQDTKEIARTLGNVTLVLTALLGAVAAVSLLVGGIGIMNIMLVSVTERTREIGIRLAIGAFRNEVLLQFLLEAVLLCLVGGLLGVALGLGGSYAATRALKLPFKVDPWVVGVAFGFAAAIGVAFGYLPARRAAQLNPIEALRYE